MTKAALVPVINFTIKGTIPLGADLASMATTSTSLQTAIDAFAKAIGLDASKLDISTASTRVRAPNVVAMPVAATETTSALVEAATAVSASLEENQATHGRKNRA